MARTKKRQTDARKKPELAARVAEAIALQQKGAAGAAEPLYREILAADPDQIDALHNLGVICAQSARLEEALALIQCALALKPDFTAAHNSLGIVFRRMGRGVEAIEHYERALRLDPHYVDARSNLGLALRVAGRFDDAVAQLGEVVRLKPASAEAQLNLGLALKDAGHIEAALTSIREAISLRPDHAESHRALGAALGQAGKNDEAIAAYGRALALKPEFVEALSNLGDALLKEDRIEEAKDAYRRALALKPDNPGMLCNLGAALNNVGQQDEAIQCYRRALELRPDFAEALINLGATLQEADRLKEAENVILRAIALRPDFAAAHTNLGVLRGAQNRFDEAIACYRHAIELQADSVEAYQNLCAALCGVGDIDEAIASGRHALEIEPSNIGARFNLSIAVLSIGEFAEGLDLYEVRPSHKDAARRLKLAPLWSLDARSGSRVLIYSEQGLGDSIQFARYVPLVEARGDHVVLETRGPLRRLMNRLGKATLIEPGEKIPPVDYQISLVSLPRIFGTRLDSIPADVPYLRADEGDIARFQARLAGEKLTVGLVWRGNPVHKNDHNRSLDPALLAPLFNVEGVRFISLQKQPREGDLETLRRLGSIEDWTEELEDFADTAALIDALDLVISVDTSVAHMAGALAKPVWILLPRFGDWRWLMNRKDSPWYPTARLFHQTKSGAWPGVIERVAAALRERVAGGRPPRAAPLKVEDDAGAILREGMAQLQRGDLARALTSFERAAALDPRNASAQSGLGTIHEKQGNLEAAAACFARAAEVEPQSIHHWLGLAFVLRRLGRHEEAIAAAERAVTLDGNSIDALLSLGMSLKNAGRSDDALPHFARAVELRPNEPQVQLGHANALYELKRYEEAVTVYRRALEIKPDYAEAKGNLGVVLKELGRHDEAIVMFKQALEQLPDSAELLTTYGNTLRSAGRHEEALVQYQKSLALKPDLAITYNNLGIALAALGRKDEALDAYNRALARRPDFPETYNNLGNLLKGMARHDEARIAYDRALALKPDFSEAELNRVNIDYEFGRFETVIPAYRAVLARAPAFADAHFNLALALLTHGEFAEGWEEHEWRWQRPGVKPHGFKQPLWRIDAPRGSRVLLHTEQGIGDTIQMARYVPKVVALGQRVQLGAPKVLRRLLSLMPDIDVIKDVGDHGAIDYQIPMLSLPRAFGTRLDTIPSEVPYLSAPAEAAARYREKLGAGFKLGLVWRGSTIHKNDHNRSIDPSLLAPLFGIEGIKIVSLQKEPRPGDLEIVGGLGPFVDLTGELADFADTAALVDALDLVISVDTSVAHLAGALGKTLFLMLPFVPDWRWLLEREDSPWYPTARLFRQTSLGDWASVIERVAAALRERVEVPPGGHSGPQNQVVTYDASQAVLARLADAVAAHGRGKSAEAERLYRAVLATSPAQCDALNNLGAICAESNRLDEAMALIERALAAHPDFAVAHNSYGIALRRLDRLDEAVRHYERAVALDPHYAEAFTNLGLALRALGRRDEAVAAMRRVVALRPESGAAHMSLSSTLLMLGAYEEGWKEYEWRFRSRDSERKPPIAPPWSPNAEPNKRVLVCAEQGIGDEIMFASMFPDLQRAGMRVTAEADPRLLPLFRRSFPGMEFVSRETGPEPMVLRDKPDYDVAAGSLGQYFRRREAEFPRTPFLVSDPARRAALREKLFDGRLLCGLSWWTKSARTGGKRNPDHAAWTEVLAVDGVKFVSLQYDGVAAGLDKLARHSAYGIETEPSVDTKNDLDGFAALIDALDLVISIQNSTVHFAGALGKEVWVLLPSVPSWRWLLGQEDSLWYPKAGVFQQKESGDWTDAMKRVAAALRDRVGRQKQ